MIFCNGGDVQRLVNSVSGPKILARNTNGSRSIIVI